MGTYFKSMPENRDEIINEYGNILFRICLIMLGNSSDAEDAVQETMIKYMNRRCADEKLQDSFDE